MTVLAIGIVSVLGAVSSCLRSSDAAAGYSRATVLAQQVAAELARNETLEPDTYSGAFDDIALGYVWSAQIAGADDEGLYPVRITVSWAEGTRRFDLETALRPHALPQPLPAEETAGTGVGAGTNPGAGTGTGATSNPGTGAGTGGAGAQPNRGRLR
jgi:hypothetical protein